MKQDYFYVIYYLLNNEYVQDDESTTNDIRLALQFEDRKGAYDYWNSIDDDVRNNYLIYKVEAHYRFSMEVENYD